MIRVRAYYSAAIRGSKGNQASAEDIRHNTEQGIARGAELQARFGSLLDLYVPHAHDVAIQIMWKKSEVSVEAILDADCAIIETCDFMFVDGFHSGGVLREIQCCEDRDIPIIYLDHNMDKSSMKVHDIINRILRKKTNG